MAEEDTMRTIMAKLVKGGSLTDGELRELQVRVDQIETASLKGHHHTYSKTDTHYTHHDSSFADVSGVLEVLRQS